MHSFHIFVHVAPGSEHERQIILRDESWTVLDLSVDELGSSFARSFEEALSGIERLPRMFIEPDGSFVCVNPSPEKWQIDGQLNDGPTGLNSVEIKGTIAANAWESFLKCLGWPRESVVVQLVREGLFMSESEFRRYATTS